MARCTAPGTLAHKFTVPLPPFACQAGAAVCWQAATRRVAQHCGGTLCTAPRPSRPLLLPPPRCLLLSPFAPSRLLAPFILLAPFVLLAPAAPSRLAPRRPQALPCTAPASLGRWQLPQACSFQLLPPSLLADPAPRPFAPPPVCPIPAASPHHCLPIARPFPAVCGLPLAAPWALGLDPAAAWNSAADCNSSASIDSARPSHPPGARSMLASQQPGAGRPCGAWRLRPHANVPRQRTAPRCLERRRRRAPVASRRGLVVPLHPDAAAASPHTQPRA